VLPSSSGNSLLRDYAVTSVILKRFLLVKSDLRIIKVKNNILKLLPSSLLLKFSFADNIVPVHFKNITYKISFHTVKLQY